MGVNDLREWWIDRAYAEIDATAEKAAEYGPNSMVELGQSWARAAHREVSDEEAIELACFLYVKGKMGRWMDAIVRGRRPSDDTIDDIRVYMGMVQRARAVGTWPGVDQGDNDD